MMNEKREGMEIDLQKLLLTFLRRWWIIVIAAVLAGVITYYYTDNFVTPMYQAKVTIYVNNIKSGQQLDSISSSNLSTSQRLVHTYVNIIKSDTVLEKVAEASNLDLTAAKIRSRMSASQVEDTEMFNVIITHPDPALAAQIANAVAEVAPGEIENFVEGSSTKIVDYAKVPVTPSSPNVQRNCMVGVLVGIVLALAYITVIFLLDVRIKDEEDLNVLFELPVLAQIPAFIPEGSKRGRSGYDKSTYGYGGQNAEKGGEKK